MWWHGLHFLLAFGGLHPQPPAETPTFWAPQAVLLQINSNLGWTPKNASGVAQSISHFVTQKRSTSVVQKQRFQTCATSLSLQHFNWRLRRMRATPQKMTRCGWANCCLHKIKLRFVELDYCYFKYEIRSEGLPSEVFFSSHSSDISVVFVRKQLQMKLLAWLLLARLAWLVLLRQLFKNYREIFTLQEEPNMWLKTFLGGKDGA